MDQPADPSDGDTQPPRQDAHHPEGSVEPPQAADQPVSRAPLTRSPDSGVLAGVASGFAAYLGVDVTVVRIAFVVLAFFGGLGVLLYLTGWLLIPAPSDDESTGERAVAGTAGAPAWLRILLLVLLVGWFANAVGPWRSTVGWAFAFIGLGIILYRQGAAGSAPPGPPRNDRQRHSHPSPLPPAQAAPGDSPAMRAQGRPAAQPTNDVWPPEADHVPHGPGEGDRAAGLPPKVAASSAVAHPSRIAAVPPQGARRSVLGQVTLAFTLVSVGGAALLHNLGAIDPPLEYYPAVILLTVGFGLVVGALWGRAHWLIAVGAVVLPWLFAASLLTPPLEGGVGQPVWRPGAAEDVLTEYRLAAGHMTLDLSRLSLGDEALEVDASVAAGQLDIIVPPRTTVDLDGRIEAGRLHAFGETIAGVDITHRVTEEAGDGRGPLLLRVAAGIGNVEVHPPEGTP